MHDLNMAVRFACTVLALCASRASPAKLLEARVENAPIVFSLDASPGLGRRDFFQAGGGPLES